MMVENVHIEDAWQHMRVNMWLLFQREFKCICKRWIKTLHTYEITSILVFFFFLKHDFHFHACWSNWRVSCQTARDGIFFISCSLFLPLIHWKGHECSLFVQYKAKPYQQAKIRLMKRRSPCVRSRWSSKLCKGQHDRRLMKRRSPCVRSRWSPKVCKDQHDRRLMKRRSP